jgi:hypothetical protein
MTSWRKVAAAVDDTTVVLDSCSLKQSSSAWEHHQLANTDARLNTHIGEQPPVYRREIGDKRKQGLKDLELYIDALCHGIAHCLYDGGE